MKLRIGIALVVIAAVSSCIGTDIVEEVIVPEEVSITGSIDSLAVGDSFVFTADFFNEFGRRADDPINWQSSDPAVIGITEAGLATALTEGNVLIYASVGTVRDSVMVNSGNTTSEIEDLRTGTFQGLRNYRVEGVMTLRDTGNELELTFGTDFRASNGPGLFVYLSNSGTSVTGGIELGSLQSNSGMQTYVISKNDAQLNTYSHVVIYCKPFGVSFGFGEFED